MSPNPSSLPALQEKVLRAAGGAPFNAFARAANGGSQTSEEKFAEAPR